jgi:DNA-binding NarL/FixJ family response regulator/two-component sensor histidine kinase
MILELTKETSTDTNQVKIVQAQTLLNQLSARIRDLSFDLRPAILDDLGLLPALAPYFERYTAQTQITVNFRHAGLEQRFQPETETATFRIIQEALTNVARHSSVSEVNVKVWIAEDVLHFVVEDYGNGFDLETTLTGATVAGGLTRMHGRAALLGGYLNIESKRGVGTRVVASLPAATLDTPARIVTFPDDIVSDSTMSAHNSTGEKKSEIPKTIRPKPEGAVTKLVLADSYDLIRQGMRSLLEAEPDFSVVGEAADGRQAIEAVKQLKPDVLIVDFALPELNGSEVTRQILEILPQTRVLMLSVYSGEAYVLESLKSGAMGYVLKHSNAGDLVQAVKEVSAGRRYLSPLLSERALEAYVKLQRAQDPDLRSHGILTPREYEVLRLVAEGHTNAEIAEQLSISPRTAETHRANIMHKLNLRNQADLVRYALQNGIISPEA